MHGLLKSLPLAMPSCSSCPASPRPHQHCLSGKPLVLRSLSKSLLSGTHKETPPCPPCVRQSGRASGSHFILTTALGWLRTLEAQVQPHGGAILVARSFWGCSPALDTWGLSRACELLPVDQTSKAAPFSYLLEIKFGVHTAIK